MNSAEKKMRDDDLVRVELFPSMTAARLAIAALAEHEIVAQVNDEEGTFDLGLGGDNPETEVIVMRKFVERAKEIVALLDVPEDEVCPAWTCSCGEDVDQGFFACWSCGNEYDPGQADS